ncbi:MAG: DUF493 domain-containing protein [Rhodothermaceae bacterium]|nr:DUF493 domain-containing protein [Rhodothermaceae bacterium]
MSGKEQNDEQDGSKNKQWWTNFQKLLDEGVEWPHEYVFKFIVPSEKVDEVKRLFNRIPVEVKASSKGTYASVTARMNVHSSDEVIAVYTAAAKIEGIILL